VIVVEANVSKGVLEAMFDLAGGSAYKTMLQDGGRLRTELVLDNAVPLTLVERLRVRLDSSGYRVYVTMTPDAEDVDDVVAVTVCGQCGGPLSADVRPLGQLVHPPGWRPALVEPV